MSTNAGRTNSTESNTARPNKNRGRDEHIGNHGFSEVVTGEGAAHPEQQEGVLTRDGELAIDGGKLPGRHDDFQGELDKGNHPVPGAYGTDNGT
ncbi:hypothetical protein [Fimbriimonas ginsengisoli]|uniref:Uncharacterized protein n=1 Tax=Fimbriimonas ginsengisoli Gsoil 348 TaxID=661478 RepID=A0A068NXF7_FIMGI|nr:hypothetical protein [Fimbriimonas ginsengisoli]AIE86319.1 hypothetical protein OP10G_2951 [Fimbriimonas ginsengisoli Gsoil 348]